MIQKTFICLKGPSLTIGVNKSKYWVLLCLHFSFSSIFPKESFRFKLGCFYYECIALHVHSWPDLELKIRLCQPPDGSTSPKYKLLYFITTKKICKEKNVLAFNWDRCCHLVLCLRLIPFHWAQVLSNMLLLIHSPFTGKFTIKALFRIDSSKESLQKWKDQYHWPPCTNKFTPAAFETETVFSFSQNNLSYWGGQPYWAFPFS